MFNITNYSDHPTRIGYTIFKFHNVQRAEYFEQLLKKDNVWFESSNIEDRTIVFGVRKGDFKKAMTANYLVSAKFRKKIIPNTYFRWGILIFAGIIVLLAIVGAIVKT